MSEHKKVLVGMSGGVDSSVAALLLKRQGYEVCGCTMRMYDNSVLSEDSHEGGCCSLADTEDAKSVCRKIGIDHITLNFTDDFGKYVMKPFAESYIRGETPNPCIECNRYMKFDMMLRRAELLGFDYIATGHYAQVVYDGDRGRYLLCRSADRKKDQTYVLYTLTQHQLAHTLFPLFGLDKPAIRQLAEENGLVNSKKPDSQDICFVPDGDYASFIERYTGYKPAKGDFIDPDGTRLGTHSGLLNYTIGQRRGLGVTFGKPVYVTAKNPADNTVTLSETELTAENVYLRDVNFIAFDSPEEPVRVTAKVRYNAREQEAIVYPADEKGIVRIEFPGGVKNPAPGQACVFYDGDIAAGGGVII